LRRRMAADRIMKVLSAVTGRLQPALPVLCQVGEHEHGTKVAQSGCNRCPSRVLAMPAASESGLLATFAPIRQQRMTAACPAASHLHRQVDFPTER
jgi:hypothetical protein